MEKLNIQCIEQQQVLITLTLTDSNGAPVDLTKYAVYAASVGAVDPYCRRAARLEWATAINNECSAFIITAPGHDIARAPWKYTIYIKNRQLGLEWAVVTGRVELTPRACGTDGISPAAYSVACEANPSGLVNVTLDATVGSISETLEQVKASAAAAASAAQNAHADLEDAETAATKASQAALAAAADARIASDKATAAEAAATAAPEACAPFVGQVQSAAVQAQQAATHAEEDANRASTAATTATEKAQVATDAAEEATTASSDLASARDTAVQAAATAQAARQTAQLASTTATTAAENAREYAEDAQQAKQAAATSETTAATAAQQASDSASAAAASAATAQASAATAVSAKSDLETARDAAAAAATTATDAAAAAATSETNATAAATAAATAQAAAEAAQVQADTDARAVAILVPRAEAAQQAAANSASAAAASETAAAASATAAAASVTNAVTKSYLDTVIQDEELRSMVYTGYAAQLLLRASSLASSTTSVYVGKLSATTAATRLGLYVDGGAIGSPEILVTDRTITLAGWEKLAEPSSVRVLIAPNLLYDKGYGGNANYMKKTGPLYIDAPKMQQMEGSFISYCNHPIYFSPDTIFMMLTKGVWLFKGCTGKITFNPGTSFSALEDAGSMFYGALGVTEFPEGVTFAMVKNANSMFYNNSALTSLPQTCAFSSITSATNMFCGCTSLEIDDLARVLATFNNLQELETPIQAQVGLPKKCKHNGAVVDTYEYLNANLPETIGTLNKKGWTTTFE